MAAAGQVERAFSANRARPLSVLAGFVALAAVLAATFPVQLSIAAVFVFAGPHNWMEARYFAARMPVRWAHQRGFFLAALAGVIALSATFSLLPVDRTLWHCGAALWTVLLVRSARRPGFAIALPIALFWMAFAFVAPPTADLVLVFLHPLVALWFVHRQIAASRPEWLAGFRAIAAAVIPAAAIIFAIHAGDPANGAEASFLKQYLAPPFVALHAFLELLHYGAWVMLLPLIGLASAPWDLRAIPLAQPRRGWPKLVTLVFVAGAVAVVLLWICFAIDYRTTREIYFTLAILHVMAEIPFLAWLR